MASKSRISSAGTFPVSVQTYDHRDAQNAEQIHQVFIAKVGQPIRVFDQKRLNLFLFGSLERFPQSSVMGIQSRGGIHGLQDQRIP